MAFGKKRNGNFCRCLQMIQWHHFRYINLSSMELWLAVSIPASGLDLPLLQDAYSGSSSFQYEEAVT